MRDGRNNHFSEMGNRIKQLFCLVLLCAFDGWTYIGVSSSATKNCTQREGTSFTVLMEPYFLWEASYLKKVLDRLPARFTCVTRQYTAVILDYAETTEIISADKDQFSESLEKIYSDYSYYLNLIHHCNQTLLHGLKRALELSPEESVVYVFTLGSMIDYNDTRLLSDVFALLKGKKLQVYFLLDLSYCTVNPTQQQIFKDISFVSYGELIDFHLVDMYQLMYSVEVLMSKPLHQTSEMKAMNLKVNVTNRYTKDLNVSTTFTHLLITRDYRFTFNLIDPNGNALAFMKYPMSNDYSYYQYCSSNFNTDFCSDLHRISSHLVKNPTSGTWTIHVLGNGLFSAQILGFTGKPCATKEYIEGLLPENCTHVNNPGNCSDLRCHPNATCEEFGGYGECTCKEGFAGDGFVCDDIDECLDFYSNNCWWYGSGSCLNTIGSYTCYCDSGTRYDGQFGCVDIDECADSALNNCHPLAVCTNYYEFYTCTCPYGYYGDGRYCEVNECLQGSPCNSSEECIKHNGSYSCFDPCSNHTVLNDPWRSTSNILNSYDMWHCDSVLQGWYRFKSEYNQQIPEYCVPPYSCGTQAPVWLNGSHPTASHGIANRTVCAHRDGNCCSQSYDISLKRCPGGFYVYKLPRTQTCLLAYCTEPASGCSGIDCAADEECRSDDGVPGCHCSKSSVTNYGSKNITAYGQPQVSCGLDHIRVTFSKCLLEQLGYNTSSIYLGNDSCRGVIDRRDRNYIVLMTRPQNGSCGAKMWNDGSYIINQITVYLARRGEEVLVGDEQSINVTCSYPLKINLLSTMNPLTTTVPMNVVSYTLTMGLFQDSRYTIPFTGSEVRINSAAMLYVSVTASRVTGSSPFVLIMKNCYATPTVDDYGIKYDIIRDQCPNKNDPTISVQENGVSLKGRFSIQMFRFVASNQVYLHCQVGLCDPFDSDCSAHCPLMRASPSIKHIQNMRIGPIRNTGFSVLSAKLFIATVVFLVLL